MIHGNVRRRWGRATPTGRALACALSLWALLSPAPADAQNPTVRIVVSPPAAAAPTIAGNCAEDWARHAYASAHDAVVRVRSLERAASGVIVQPGYVATTFHVVEVGREVDVTLSDGRSVRAEVVATDPAHNIAMLRLLGPAGPPIAPADARMEPDLGAPVVVLSAPEPRRGFPLGVTITRGVLSGSDSEVLRTDAAIDGDSAGAPLLGCDGALLGMVTGRQGAVAVVAPLARLQALQTWTAIAPAQHYRGHWSVHGQFGGLVQLSPGMPWLGYGAGVSLVGYDRVVFQLRAGMLFGLAGLGPDVLDGMRLRITTELTGGYRFLLHGGPMPVYLGLHAGLVLNHDLTSQDRLVPSATEPSCAGVASAVCVQRSDSSRTTLRPALGASLMIGHDLELSYTLQLDPLAPSQSTHGLGVMMHF
jgi:hypothetical protein